MSTAYWAQFSHAEIMSMHGVEVDAYHDDDLDDCHDDGDEDLEEAACCSNGCMDCLGLSWRDFM
jgi:hypothetical protein